MLSSGGREEILSKTEVILFSKSLSRLVAYLEQISVSRRAGNNELLETNGELGYFIFILAE